MRCGAGAVFIAVAAAILIVVASGFRRLQRNSRRHGLVARARDHCVNTGLEFRQRLVHRKGGDDILVEHRLRIQHAGPDFLSAFLQQLARLVAIDLREKILRADGLQQVAVADAHNIHGDLRRIDGDDRNSLLPDARQNIILAREMHLRRAVLHEDFEVGGFQKIFADR